MRRDRHQLEEAAARVLGEAEVRSAHDHGASAKEVARLHHQKCEEEKRDRCQGTGYRPAN